MGLNEILIDGIATTAGIFGSVFLLQRLHPARVVGQLERTVRQSLRVVASRRISQHWKERVVPAYALSVLAASLRLALIMALLAGVFVMLFTLVYLPFVEGPSAAFHRLLRWQPQAMVMGIGLGYLLYYRHRRSRDSLSADDSIAASRTLPSQGRPAVAYNQLERVLHRLALGQPLIRRAAFDLDCLLTRNQCSEILRPVYVAGLARSGTTVLLEILLASGEFTSLTYRHMPFVTAPGFWSALSKYFRRPGQLRERAHGDGLEVGPDSPEAFEEVFWLMMLGRDYVIEHGLLPHTADAEVVAAYRCYVGNILTAAACKPGQRYLCKGNNNLLRIRTLLHACPDAYVVIPFRNPLAHADSLMRQHQRFVEIHSHDAFSLHYMNWLGHFEFGENMKPFLFSEQARPAKSDESMSLSYWLRYWGVVYGQLWSDFREGGSAGIGRRVLFFDYDRLCVDPIASLERLASAIDVDPDVLVSQAARVNQPARTASIDDIPAALSDHLGTLYEQLRCVAI